MAFLRLFAICSLLHAVVPWTAQAASFVVDGRANGQFGTYGPSLIRDGLDLVEGEIFGAAGEAIELSATGSVFLGTGVLPTTDPDGAGPFDRVAFLAAPTAYLSLEEALVDAAGTLPTSFSDIGALFAVFVPEAVATSGGFLARNVDVGGSIDSDALFLVGTGPLIFTAPEAGRLYFGVNDALGGNNTGSYTVNTTAVPEPSTAILIGLGLMALAGSATRSPGPASASSP
ncbi:MAG: PEP-CTERM sorting domain-containing protein [Myxococcota bacterium]